MAIKTDKALLEKACKNIIETILFCLPNSYKGTVYLTGRPPEMIVKRITSGVIDEERKTISWELPERSDYNAPGKPWIGYRDEPGRPLEAMAWCVERQKSWTAEDPGSDCRSVRLQVEGVFEDSHHMEPVLIRKRDLCLADEPCLEFPRNYNGEMLWQNNEYMVVAVIKIHFRPHTIKIGSPETKIVKRLSRALGTELLSYQLREQSVEAMRQVAQDKLNSCNTLAHSLRNVITKSGFIFSLIKLELGFLRDEWERVLLEHSDQKGMKQEAIRSLNEELKGMGEGSDDQIKKLMEVQNQFLGLSLPPERGEMWVCMQVEERWKELLAEIPMDEERANRILRGIDQLKRSLYLGKDPDILTAYDKIPESLKKELTDLIYTYTDQINFQFLDRLIRILEDPSLNLPYQNKSRKSLIQLKILAEIMSQLENNTNVVLQQVLNGTNKGRRIGDGLNI
ncbi:MAG: hypothetical protein ABIF87_14685 [Pseudomonadota bacterium]